MMIRPARPEDLDAAVDLFLESVADLIARHGLKIPPPPRERVATGYRHILQTGIFQVADLDGKIAALACAVVRGSRWFLSGFWAAPGLQRRGIGGPLLRAVRDAGARAGARTFFTWSSVDVNAIGNYLRIGLYPGYPVFSFAGAPTVDRPSGYELLPLSADEAAALDDWPGRETDHAFFAPGHKVVHAGQTAGYFYAHGGSIGPARWTAPAHAEAILSLALEEARRQSSEVRLVAPGCNPAAIRRALDSGLQVVAFANLLTSGDLGDMASYLPFGPLLF